MALVCVVSSANHPAKKVCCLREKTRHSSARKGRIKCLKHWNGKRRKCCVWISLSAVTKKDQHLIVSATFAFFHSEWYTHYHETGKSKVCYRSRAWWCTSFRKNVNKTLATKTTYKKSGEKTLDILKGYHLLLHILGLQTSSIYLINNKTNDDIILTSVHEKITNLKKNNRAKWRWSAMQNSVGVQPDSMDGQCD